MSAARFIFTVMGVVLIFIGLATAILEMMTKGRDRVRTNVAPGSVLHPISVQSIVMMGLGAAMVAAAWFMSD